MEYKQLINFLKIYGNISQQEEENLKTVFSHQSVNKKTILIHKNSPCNKLFFVNKGLLRAYYTDDNGKETTRMIAWENRFLTNIVSFRNDMQNQETIECIEKAEILIVTKNDFEILMKSSLNLKSIYADILEEYNGLHISRFEQLHSGDALEKLEYFNANFQPLKNRINDSILSSFLAISRKTIERIKKI